MLIARERLNEEPGILERIRQGKQVGHYETVGLRKDGTTVDISLAVSPVFDDNGNIVGASRIARDITERKRAEEERSGLLFREQAARAEAEAANRLKDEFLAIVSHEVRTPLNAIVGWIQMLRSGKLNDDQIRKALETIDRNAASQETIITELLDTSRIISGKMKLDPKPLDLPSIIEAAIEIMRPAAEAKSIEIDTKLDRRAGLTWGDSARLQQVLWNLLSNAIKFTPKGGHVEVRFERLGTDVAIIVKDTGEGIEPDFLPYVFERFRQAEAATTRVYGGLGLGLSIVRNIVEMHGGSVRVESEGKGRGATFTVILPIRALADFPRDDERRVIREAQLEDFSAHPTPKRLDGVSVLVVDDHADTRELLSVALTTSGAEVTTCESSNEALTQIRRRKPDCIVSDVGMPGEDGYGFMKKLRALQAKDGGKIPAIALTGFAGADHKILANAAGYQVHLPKPVALAELTAEIARLVAQN